ncbi:hypothetical protein [Rahnella sp. AN3-3W3]|uniref:hypothetical protein n=1 Tax=Rahnella sp. AN3-3W3 TaxID=1610578 RepID=UPI0013006DD7|nr:hypothetical protein [Rahnella sp. AN3-3W3]
MTDTTDIKALRPAERAKLGFVTDDNTGGYYVAECEECGKIFPSQTCDGGEQIADSGDYGDCYCPHCGFIDPLECDNANLVWNVQQLKIVNLTKQLEAERQRADKSDAMLSECLESLKAAEKELGIRSHQLVKADASVADLEKRLRCTEETLIAVNDLLTAAEARVKELKGEQVPVITCYSCRKVMTRNQHAEADGFCPYCDVEIELDEDELFTAPQKPVVLSFDAWCESKGDKPLGWVREAMKEAYDAAIEAAGSIVKDGE